MTPLSARIKFAIKYDVLYHIPMILSVFRIAQS